MELLDDGNKHAQQKPIEKLFSPSSSSSSLQRIVNEI